MEESEQLSIIKHPKLITDTIRRVKGLLGLNPLGLISRLLRGSSKTSSLYKERRYINLNEREIL
jgi:hypothetical protein